MADFCGPWRLAHRDSSIGPGFNGQLEYVVDARGEEVCGPISHVDMLTIYAREDQVARVARGEWGPFRVYRDGEPFPYSANAHLIAAAPDMHDLLSLILHRRRAIEDGEGLTLRPCRVCGEDTGWPVNDPAETECEECAIAAVLAKAEGRS